MTSTVGRMTAGQKVFFGIYAFPVVLFSGAFFIAGAVKPDWAVMVVAVLFPISTLATWSPVIVRLRRRLLPLTWSLVIWTFLLGPFAFLISRGR
jgi:hypothetical protein